MRVGDRVQLKKKLRRKTRYREWMYRLCRWFFYSIIMFHLIIRGEYVLACLVGGIVLDFASVHWRFTKVRDVLRAFIAMVEAMSTAKEEVKDDRTNKN